MGHQSAADTRAKSEHAAVPPGTPETSPRLVADPTKIPDQQKPLPPLFVRGQAEELAAIAGRPSDWKQLRELLNGRAILRAGVLVSRWPKENPIQWQKYQDGALHLRAAADVLQELNSRSGELVNAGLSGLNSVPRGLAKFVSNLRYGAEMLEKLAEDIQPGPGNPRIGVAENIALYLGEIYIEFSGCPFKPRATKRDVAGPDFVRRAMEMLRLDYGDSEIGTAMRYAGKRLQERRSK